MKRILVCAALAGMLSFAACPVDALECQTTVVIPDRFAVTMCPNVDPATKFDKKELMKSAKEIKDQQKVEQGAIVFYAPGKKPGDGAVAALAFGGLNEDGELIVAPEGNEEAGKLIEKIIGYEIKPKELWKIYDDNEVVADEDFKGKVLLMKVKNTGLAKDPMGKPYIKVPTDQFDLEGLHIYLSKNDPFLRQLKKGQTVVIRAIPKGFVMRSVMLDGEVVYIEGQQQKGKKK